MTYQASPKSQDSLIDGYVLTYSASDGYLKPKAPPLQSAVWQPGGTNSGNVYTDWSTVVAVAAASPQPFTIVFEDFFAPCTIPAGSWDFGPLVTFQGSPNGEDGGSISVDVTGGATFVHSPIAFFDFELRANGTAAIITSTLPDFRVEFNNAFLNLHSPTNFPIYDVTANIHMFMYNGSSAGGTQIGFPVVKSTGTINAYLYGGSSVDDYAFDATGNVFYFNRSDSSRPSLTQTASSTSILVSKYSPLDPYGILSYGSTSNRPSLGGITPGYRYFDTTLGKPIWWNGSSWVLADGTAA